MPYNGSGTFNRVYDWTDDEANGIDIEASRMDTEMDGFATGLSNCLTKDGQNAATADLSMGSNKIINVNDPTNPQDAATKAYVDAFSAFADDAVPRSTSTEVITSADAARASEYVEIFRGLANATNASYPAYELEHKNSGGFTRVGAVGCREGRIRIYVSDINGSSNRFSCWEFDDNGDLTPTTDNARSLGSGSKRPDVIHAVSGTINTSDEREKQGIASIDNDLIDAFLAIEPKVYQWKNSTVKLRSGKLRVKNADEARWHMGFISQHLESALKDAGKDPARYAIWCKDDIGDGKVRYGLRYEQFIALMEAANRRRFSSLESRIAALEAKS